VTKFSSSFKLALQIGATIGQSFRSAVQGSQKQLGQLGASIQKLKNQQAAIKKVELAEANVGKARVAYNTASKALLQLRKQIAQTTDKPSQQLTQSFEAAKKKTEQLSNQLVKQRERLQASRRALEQTGLSSQFTAREQAKLGSSVDKLNQKYRQLSQTMQAQQAVKARRSELRGQLFDAVALGAAVAAPLKVAIGFEQAIAKLGAITRSSGESLTTLEGTAKSLGETTLFSANEAAQAMTFLGMAGFNTNQIIAATPGMLSLAQAAGSDLAQTADIASNILSGFSLEADSMNRVGDVLAATFTRTNTTLQMLGDTLKYAAPIASSAGASIEEVAAMAGLLGNVGIQGSLAGTALRAAFINLSAPPKAAADALAELGIEVSDLDGNLRSVPELLKDIAQATEMMGSVQRADIISSIFGKQATAGLTELINQAGQGGLDHLINELQTAQGTAGQMAQQMSDTTHGSLKLLGSALESVAISLGSVLLPTVATGAKVFASMASKLSVLSQKYPRLTKFVVGLTTSLIAFKVVAIAGAYAYTFLKGAVLSLAVGYRTLSAGLTLTKLGLLKMNALSALSAAKLGIVTAAQWAWNIALRANPIGLIITGIAALVGAGVWLIKNWDSVGEFFTNLWQSIKTTTTQAVDWLLGKIQVLSKPFQWLGKAWHKVGEFMGGDSSFSANVLAQQPNRTLATASLDAIAPAIATHHATHRTNQTVRIDAPITIQAQAGVDAKTIAEEVQKALEQQQLKVQRQQRVGLFDG
jgi:TP901 family phage tail tape measure protein